MRALPPSRDYRDADSALLLTALIEPTSSHSPVAANGTRCQRSRVATHSMELPRRSSPHPLSIPTQDSPPMHLPKPRERPNMSPQKQTTLDLEILGSRLDSPRAVRALRKSFLLESPVSQYAALRDETVQDEFERVSPQPPLISTARSPHN